MKPTKMKSSGELEQYIAELKEQVKQAQLAKREALAREQKQAREWRTALTQEIGATLLTVAGCDWTRLDLDAMREWLVDHAGEMQALLDGPERSPEEAHNALLAFRRGRAADAKQDSHQTDTDAPQEDTPAAEQAEATDNADAPATDSLMADSNDNETQDTPWTPQGESWQPQQGWN